MRSFSTRSSAARLTCRQQALGAHNLAGVGLYDAGVGLEDQMIGDDGRAVLGLQGRGEIFDVIFEGQLRLAAGRFQSGQGRIGGRSHVLCRLGP